MALSQELLSVEQKGQIFILTLRNGEDNQLSLTLCKETLAALDYIQEQLGLESEGALIIQGNNPKFFTNVSSIAPRHCSLRRLPTDTILPTGSQSRRGSTQSRNIEGRIHTSECCLLMPDTD